MAVETMKSGKFPLAIYEFSPHSTFAQMSLALPRVAAIGFDFIQMPPIHPPGTHRFHTGDGKTKLGSAYAPRDHLRVSPHVYADVEPEDYLKGNYEDRPADEGWEALSRFTAEARRHGLGVVADIVFSHTAGDPDVVARHAQKFGDAFYVPEEAGKDGAEAFGADRGQSDSRLDVRQIDHSGSAGDEIQGHFEMVLRRFIESRVKAFRMNDATGVPARMWRFLLDGARRFAAEKGLPIPTFIGQTENSSLDDELRIVRDGGFDGLTDSMRWWTNLSETWFPERYSRLSELGAGSVSFAGAHDIQTFADHFRENQGRFTRLAMTALMTSTALITQGTLGLALVHPTVFLEHHIGMQGDPLQDFTDSSLQMRGLMSMLLDIKRSHPVLHSPGYMEIHSKQYPFVTIRKSTSTEEALMVFNTGDRGGTYVVPELFRGGYLFGTNNGWFGKGNLGETIVDYDLEPSGMAVFLRDF